MEVAGAEMTVRKKAFEEAQVIRDSDDTILGNGSQHPLNRYFPRFAPNGKLSQERIVVDGHRPTRVHAAINAHTRAGGLRVLNDRAGTGEEIIVGILGIYAALQG